MSSWEIGDLRRMCAAGLMAAAGFTGILPGLCACAAREDTKAFAETAVASAEDTAAPAETARPVIRISTGTGADFSDASEDGTADAADAGSAGSSETAASGSDAAAEGTGAAEDSREALLTFVGDCTLGGDPTIGSGELFSSLYAKYGPDYFFQNVRDVFSADDLTMINLEGTFTRADTRADKKYCFRADPACVDVLTGSSVELCNLANNHSRDYGEKSYEDTVNTLDGAGIRWVRDEDVCLVELGGVKVGIAGVYELPRLTGADSIVQADIAKLKEQGAEYICVEFHWGIEGEDIPDQNQVALAHSAIDGGADLVVGAHPHVLQGIEIYQGRPIVYSMGNFCFGGNLNPKDKDTMIYQLRVRLDSSGQIASQMENVIPCRLSSSEKKNDMQPVILTGDEAERVLQKIQERSDLLAKTYGTEADRIGTSE
jgi:poly-gamma-glutamate capsule biosynthesis protein CapA/YwtB (metallophosphatase superfamily)